MTQPPLLREIQRAWVAPELIFVLGTADITMSLNLIVSFFHYYFLISQSAERHGCDRTMAIFYAEGPEDCIFWERQHRLCNSLWVRNTISKNSELVISLMKRTGKNWGWENGWCRNSVEYTVWSDYLCLQIGWNSEFSGEVRLLVFPSVS